MIKFACLLGDKDNMGHLIGHMGKCFLQLLQILVNWNENLRINIDKDLSLHLQEFVTVLAQMGTSDMLDDEFEIDPLES